MRRLFLHFLICLTIYLLLLACDGTEEVVVNPPLVVEISTVINLTSFEKIDPGSNTFELRCLSQDDFPCANYTINHDLNVSIDSIDLHFTEISRPQICLTNTGKAFGIVSLGALANNTYEFPIRINDDTVSAQIIITDSTFEISNGDGNWTNILRPMLRRIPDNVIWGQVGYHNFIDVNIALTYFDSLDNFGGVAGTLSSGSYGYFYVDTTGQADSVLELGPSMGTTYTIPYVYHYTGDTSTLHTLIQNFANQGNTVEVNVITNEGVEFRSW
jgi:hypothetical protein